MLTILRAKQREEKGKNKQTKEEEAKKSNFKRNISIAIIA